MSNNRLVRDTNSKKLGGTRKNQTKSSPTEAPRGAVQVTHDNDPLLAYLRAIAINTKSIAESLMKVKNG